MDKKASEIVEQKNKINPTIDATVDGPGESCEIK